jgi:hypothetical protein
LKKPKSARTSLTDPEGSHFTKESPTVVLDVCCEVGEIKGGPSETQPKG